MNETDSKVCRLPGNPIVQTEGQVTHHRTAHPLQCPSRTIRMSPVVPSDDQLVHGKEKMSSAV